MTALLQIVCDNCGAKYRLPESFQNATAKCKQCGSQIDVAGQRKVAAEPRGSAPAQGTARSARTGRRTGRRGTGAGDAQQSSGSKLPFVLAGVGLLAVVVVVVLMMKGGDGKQANKAGPAAAQPGKSGTPQDASGG